MILSTRAVGIKTYGMGDGSGVSALTNVTYNTIRTQNPEPRTQNPEYAIRIQSRHMEPETHCKIHGNNAVLKEMGFENF
ncbi:hypothetical protein KCU77_g8752, partial [Aureobasidium melanogenum]